MHHLSASIIVQMEVTTHLCIGSNWLKYLGHRFTKLQERLAAVRCVAEMSITVWTMNGKHGALFENR